MGKRVDLLLVYADPKVGASCPPLGAGCIAAALKREGIHVDFWDMSVMAPSIRALVRAIRDLDPPVVGLSCYPWNYEYVMQLSKMLDAALPDATMILGGVHAGYIPEQVFADTQAVDIIVKGEAETRIGDLVKRLLGNEDYTTVAGIAYRQEGSVVQTDMPSSAPSMDDLPSPYLEEVFDLERYNYVTLSLARGCPMSCIFCSWGSPAIEGKLRGFSMDRIEAELDFLHHSGVKRILSSDATFNARPKVLVELATLHQRKGYRFDWIDLDMRADLCSEPQLDMLVEMGAKSVGFGYESCHEKTLRLINKHIDPATVAEMSRAARKRGLKVHCGVIVGLPGEDENDVAESVRFAVEQVQPTELGIFPLRVQPGTVLYHHSAVYGIQVGSMAPNHTYIAQTRELSYQKIMELVETHSLSVRELNRVDQEHVQEHVRRGVLAAVN